MACVRVQSSSSSRTKNFDVFVSFRGADTRNGFTDHLFAALQRKGVVAFRDDHKIRKGELLEPELLQAIEGSRVFIVVFSKDYASSTWCLKELTKIVHSVQQTGRSVLPIFYDVTPSEVRKQTGKFGEAFAEHEERFKDDLEMVKKWREALKAIANLCGWDVQNKPQHEEIEKIVEDVVNILGHNQILSFDDNLVDMHSRVKQLEELLSLGANEVRVIGICGMGGIGKTALASALYNKILPQFDVCCFIDDVSKIYRGFGPLGAQKQLLRQTLNQGNVEIDNFLEGAMLVRNRLCNAKALIVLDNVDQVEQLEKLALYPKYLGAGSRIIIISRDIHILKSCGVDEVYSVQLLDTNNALQLFCRKAFKSGYIVEGYEGVTYDVLKYANGLPLAIKVLGSYLFDRNIPEWRNVLARLRENPNKGISKVVKMHDLLIEFGRSIVRAKSPKEPRKRSRLWDYGDEGTNEIENMCLDSPSLDEEIRWDGNASEKMTNLKLRIIRNSWRVLEWSYPLNSLPSNFHLEGLAICKLPHNRFLSSCKIIHLQKFMNLTALNFDECKYLTRICDVSSCPNLEKLSFKRCRNLVAVHESIGFLGRLKKLNAEGCSKLKSFPPIHLTSLRELNVSNCKHLQEIKGLPPNIERFYAINCKSLSSLSRSMLMNQELYEARMSYYVLPGACIPEWFDHQSRGPSTSFWFRNNFPHKVLCLLIAPVKDKLGNGGIIAPMVFINGKVHEPDFHIDLEDMEDLEMDHTCIFDLDCTWRCDQFEVPLENEWNHVKVTFAGVIETSIIKATGIHVFKHESNNEDIQLFNPYEKRKPLVYDVFLNFKGSDTLHGFTGYLYKALHDSGIHTFIDNKELQRGEEITPEIVKAIEESRIAVTVFSINYASSSFCLDELASILDCLKRKRLLVLPVFYNMDPSDVRHQIGSYGEALAKHEESFMLNMYKLQKWKMALRQVANLPGFHFKHGDGYGYEYEFIGRIVEWVSSEINHTPLHVAGYPVGLHSQVRDVRKRLYVGCDDVSVIGIFGISGVGKSTLTRQVYNSIANHFDASCFIENVREKCKKHGLQHLQRILLSKILGNKDITLSSVQRRLQQKKVLLILDDVDNHEQLEAVVGGPHRFGSGSKVIIMTRVEQLLDDQRTYKMEKLNENDAIQLLKWKAFKAQYIHPRYEELLNRAVTYASGLPLSLEIIGSNLFGKSVEEWKSIIHQLEKSPSDPIQSILKASFDALEETARSIFLDICCCFNGYESAEIQDILHAHYGHSVKDYIDVLVDKSLVKLSHGTKHCYDTITLHDLIEHMGKEIEQQESLTSEPAKRRRLWLPEDIREVLGNNKGTSEIEIICLDFPTSDKEETIEWDGKAFQNMQNLRTIIIRNGNFSKGPEYLPNSLRVLEWWRYPSHRLPSDFHPKELAICKLPYSHISTIELTDLTKKFTNLKVLEFSSANVEQR